MFKILISGLKYENRIKTGRHRYKIVTLSWFSDFKSLFRENEYKPGIRFGLECVCVCVWGGGGGGGGRKSYVRSFKSCTLVFRIRAVATTVKYINVICNVLQCSTRQRKRYNCRDSPGYNYQLYKLQCIQRITRSMLMMMIWDLVRMMCCYVLSLNINSIYRSVWWWYICMIYIYIFSGIDMISIPF